MALRCCVSPIELIIQICKTSLIRVMSAQMRRWGQSWHSCVRSETLRRWVTAIRSCIGCQPIPSLSIADTIQHYSTIISILSQLMFVFTSLQRWLAFHRFMTNALNNVFVCIRVNKTRHQILIASNHRNHSVAYCRWMQTTDAKDSPNDVFRWVQPWDQWWPLTPNHKTIRSLRLKQGFRIEIWFSRPRLRGLQ